MLPPLHQFFADAAWRHMAACSKKIGGEGWGEEAVLERCHSRKPPHPAYRPPSPLEGRRDGVSHGKPRAEYDFIESESPNKALSS